MDKIIELLHINFYKIDIVFKSLLIITFIFLISLLCKQKLKKMIIGITLIVLSLLISIVESFFEYTIKFHLSLMAAVNLMFMILGITLIIFGFNYLLT